MTSATINRAIKHLNMEIVKGDGYQWFADLTHGGQVGESVMVCYLNHQTLDQWVADATHAREQETSNLNKAITHITTRKLIGSWELDGVGW